MSPKPAQEGTELTMEGSVRSVPLGPQMMEGVEVQLPPVIIGQYGSDPKKKTVLVYGASSPVPISCPAF